MFKEINYRFNNFSGRILCCILYIPSFLLFQSLFSGSNNIQIRYDLLDCNICICSTTVSGSHSVVSSFFL